MTFIGGVNTVYSRVLLRLKEDLKIKIKIKIKIKKKQKSFVLVNVTFYAQYTLTNTPA
jgi:hypothetical protein